jgi:hypothetical protein
LVGLSFRSAPPANRRVEAAFALNSLQRLYPFVQSVPLSVRPCLTDDGASSWPTPLGRGAAFRRSASANGAGMAEGTGDVDFEYAIGDGLTRFEGDATHTYQKPGTYFASFRVGAHRDGAKRKGLAVENLARVRVVVRA